MNWRSFFNRKEKYKSPQEKAEQRLISSGFVSGAMIICFGIVYWVYSTPDLKVLFSLEVWATLAVIFIGLFTFNSFGSLITDAINYRKAKKMGAIGSQ